MQHFRLCLAAFIAACLATLSASANDSEYFASGNQLVPMEETDISVAKEILTIHLGDDGMADVDVYYEFRNDGPEKHIIMGFEANAPYNTGSGINRNGIHPYIHSFSVNFNGEVLPYTNALYPSNIGPGARPFDLTKWKTTEEMEAMGRGDVVWEGSLYNPALDSTRSYSYVYKFDATFRPGINVVHHTYRYNTSVTVCSAFHFDYKLSPATRWRGHRIDDFTLRITAMGTAKHFAVQKSPFGAHPFKVVQGAGKVRMAKHPYSDEPDSMYEITLRDGIVEWHADNFEPTDELYITSADELLQSSDENFVVGAYYDRGPNYYPGLCNYEAVVTLDDFINMAYAHRGYVFPDPKQQKHFSQFWWYMPDPVWNPAEIIFTPFEYKRRWKLEYGDEYGED